MIKEQPDNASIGLPLGNQSSQWFALLYLNKIEKICNDLLDLELNEKTQIGMVKNGIDFLGYRHILSSSCKIIVKLRYSSKRRLKKHLKTVNKLYNKGIVNDEYVYQKNSLNCLKIC